MKTALSWIAMLVVVGVLPGCGLQAFSSGTSRPPSADVAERAFVKPMLGNDTTSLATVISFKKLDGYPNQDGTYTVECQYDVLMRVSLADLQTQLVEDARAATVNAEEIPRSLAIDFAKLTGAGLALHTGAFSSGSRLTARINLVFQKTEKEWRLIKPSVDEAVLAIASPSQRVVAFLFSNAE